MSHPSQRADADTIRRIMEAEGASVAQNTRGFNQGRYTSVAKLPDYEALKQRARAIKEDAIAQLPALIDQLRTTVEARGGTVYLAEDADDANRHIARLTEGAQRLVKSKSMTSEEIGTNAALQARDIDVVETDLGEWVLQLADEVPSHIVAPAIHKSREAIADLFQRTFEPDEPLETAEELTRFARQKLGTLIEGADVGMTGANFIAADTGTIVLVTSEGNARKTALVPPTYIAVAGVEKVVPTLQDVQPFVELIGRSGTGQDITSYISLFTPPFDTPVPQFKGTNGAVGNERSFHLILIDNGRLAMREDEDLRETLYCIRCSACANTCANFQEVGGHAFGGKTYSGGIATGWEAGIHGLDTADTFNDLCTGCSRCVPACPVGIDIPWINAVVQDRINRDGEGALDWLVDGLTPDDEPAGLDLSRRLFGHFATLARAGSRLAPLSNWMAEQPLVRAAMERLAGIDRRRALPAFQRHTLRRWWDARPATPVQPHGTAVLYADPYTNHVRTGRGQAAVRALEALGVEVRLSDVAPSGRAPLSQGMIQTAKETARATYDAFAPHLDAGRPIIVLEPSDLAMFWRDYAKLLPEADHERLCGASMDVLAFIQQQIHQTGDAALGLRDGRGQTVAYHSHCQQRTLGMASPAIEVLRQCGYDVVTSDVECCGMAGSFGYKADYYELSMQVGARLHGQFETAVEDGAILAASGVSCIEQLEALFDRDVAHPVELIAPDA
ncbi:MAG: (4Fe-4S)-binding protein [Bacteroidetes bacterium]|jgi:iron-sulfur cluster protein|nr:(4Fe-4S)-binding protein [Bacteroidota bacterium]